MKKKSCTWIKSILVLSLLSIVLIGCPPPVDPVVPTLTTTNVSSITAATATSGGTVTDDGGETVTERGVCWNTASAPTITNNKTADGTGNGPFTSTFSGLNPGVTYYVRAYATNSVGTAYGNEVSFTTTIIPSTVTTTAVTSIGTTTASSGGTISADGGAAISARGVCLSTTTGPTISNSKTTDGTGTGSFVSSLIALIPGAKYYVRAYATNSAGTSYGSEISFTTLANLPTITTTVVTSVTSTTASSGGNVSADGGGAITARGVCWNTSSNPTTANSKTTDAGTTGIFTSAITGLIANIAYYVRAYATNSQGTAYGNEVSFKTTASIPVSTNTDSDGNIYTTVIIGTQTWMKENLKTTKYNDGTAIPMVTDGATWTAWGAYYRPCYCWYNNSSANKDTYGALYNWYTVNTGKLCPAGWHVPTETEWTSLITYLGGNLVAGNKLKEAGTSHWLSPNTGATNETGFTAVPSGYRGGTNGVFEGLGLYDYGWLSTDNSATNAFSRNMNYYNSNVSGGVTPKEIGFSVRCLHD